MRWWLPIERPVAPERIRLYHTHAALSEWLDPLAAQGEDRNSRAEHRQPVKPWFASPVSQASDGTFGIEISTLTESLSDIVSAGPPGHILRLGRQDLLSGTPHYAVVSDWKDLAEHTTNHRWRIGVLTPTCFRLRGSGGAVSPLPAVDPMLRTLDTYWSAYSGLPSRLPDHTNSGVYVSWCDVRTHYVELRSAARAGRVLPRRVPGFVGELIIEAPKRTAPIVDPLFHLIDFVSIGSFARRGLGVARLLSASEGDLDDHLDRQSHTA